MTLDSGLHPKAQQFLTEEQAFRLGTLVTESSHPKTQPLSQTLQADTASGIRMLQSVDQDIVDRLDALFSQPGYDRLVSALFTALSQDKRIFFTGCGATGRLSILLEAAWRRLRDGTCAIPASAARVARRCDFS